MADIPIIKKPVHYWFLFGRDLLHESLNDKMLN